MTKGYTLDSMVDKLLDVIGGGVVRDIDVEVPS